jgi:hypothetical protein
LVFVFISFQVLRTPIAAERRTLQEFDLLKSRFFVRFGRLAR